jgi:hypothetical protein
MSLSIVTHDPARFAKANKAISILRSVEEGETKAVASFLAWDELVWVVRKLEGRDAGTRAGAALLNLENLSFSSCAFCDSEGPRINREIPLKTEGFNSYCNCPDNGRKRNNQ